VSACLGMLHRLEAILAGCDSNAVSGPAASQLQIQQCKSNVSTMLVLKSTKRLSLNRKNHHLPSRNQLFATCTLKDPTCMLKATKTKSNNASRSRSTAGVQGTSRWQQNPSIMQTEQTYQLQRWIGTGQATHPAVQQGQTVCNPHRRPSSVKSMLVKFN
jgi:hypothetical protein